MKLLCICGHINTQHFLHNLGCHEKPIELAGGFCRCEKYKQDNLKYLEQLYNQKVKTNV